MTNKLSLLFAAITMLFSTKAMAESVTVQVSINTGQALRSGNPVTAGTWCSKWTSTATLDGTPAVSITGQDTKNNLSCPSDDGIDLAEGSNANAYTYTISAPSGYVFTTMSAQVQTPTSDNAPTVRINNGSPIVTSGTAQSVQIEAINKQSFQIALSSAANNGRALFTDFQLTLMPRDEADIEDVVPYKVSTAEEQHWYYITNASTSATYCAGKVMYHDATTNAICFGDAALMADRLWSFWQGSNGKLAIKNYNNIYFGTAPTGIGNNTALSGTETENAIYSIEASFDAYIITDGNGQPLHAQNDGKKIVRWEATSGGASLWVFNEVDASDPEMKLSSTSVQQGKVTTARGNKDQGILRSILTVQGLTGELPLTQVKGKLVGTKLSDITAVRAYLATNAQELYVDKENGMPWREQNGTFLGEGTISEDGTYAIPIENMKLTPGQHYLWIAIDIDPEAKEGNTVDATITGYTIGGEEVAESNGNPQYAATIFLTESAVLMPMDKGSLYYRIPAITATADGKRLVTLTDDRIGHNADLPSHCYVVAQYSDDGGKTWSDPKRVAGEAATGGNYGHGDAQIITNRYTGEIIGIMTSSHNGTGFFASTVDKPQTWKVIKSADGGETWSVPVDHTASLYAKNSPNPTIKGGFSGSGAGLQKRDGTLISPFVARNTSDVNHYYNIISKDGGDTWEIYGTSGTSAADEPKILERNNGDLAISVRSGGYNYHNVSTDDGQTWKLPNETRFNSGISGNACDGEYMVWCSTLDGNPWNITLQTLPNSGNRQNVSIALSTDEGDTFGTPKTICPRGSAYSAATVMGDGTLGVYYEENGLFGGYTMRFVRFSLNWASNGKYKFTEDMPFHPIMSNDVVTEVGESGWQTLIVPFDCELPDGLTAYTSDGETQTVDGNAEDCSALLCTPVDGRTLKAHTPYLIQGTPGSYTFLRPIADWQPTALPKNCEMRNGILQGHYVNRLVKQNDAETIYNNIRSFSALNGEYAFRRISQKGSARIDAYRCNLQLPATSELYLQPTVRQVADGIQGTEAAPTIKQQAYDLTGRPAKPNQRGIVIVPGKGIIMQ